MLHPPEARKIVHVDDRPWHPPKGVTVAIQPDQLHRNVRLAQFAGPGVGAPPRAKRHVNRRTLLERLLMVLFSSLNRRSRSDAHHPIETKQSGFDTQLNAIEPRNTWGVNKLFGRPPTIPPHEFKGAAFSQIGVNLTPLMNLSTAPRPAAGSKIHPIQDAWAYSPSTAPSQPTGESTVPRQPRDSTARTLDRVLISGNIPVRLRRKFSNATSHRPIFGYRRRLRGERPDENNPATAPAGPELARSTAPAPAVGVATDRGVFAAGRAPAAPALASVPAGPCARNARPLLSLPIRWGRSLQVQERQHPRLRIIRRRQHIRIHPGKHVRIRVRPDKGVPGRRQTALRVPVEALRLGQRRADPNQTNHPGHHHANPPRPGVQYPSSLGLLSTR